MTGKLKRGRPTRSLFDSARGAFWACNLRYISQKILSEIERELNPKCFTNRDGGGYRQPNAYNKYANGTKIPTSPFKAINSPIILAEEKYKTSAEAYHSILWTVLQESENINDIDTNKYQSLIPERLKLALRENGIDLNTSKDLLLTDDEFKKMVYLKNIDVLGLMLLQIIRSKEIINLRHVFYIRQWLQYSSISYVPFKACYLIIFKLIEERIHEIGSLQGHSGLDIKKSIKERYSDAENAALLSGKMMTYQVFN